MSELAVLPLLRELMECARAFQRLSARHIRQLGLTPPQFDIIATLGDTEGMSCSDLGRNTLITKGTLTGVIDRLEQRGLVSRAPSPKDGRSVIVHLTATGQALFERIFPEHRNFLGSVFDAFPPQDLHALRRDLARLRRAFEGDGANPDEPR